MPTINFRYTSKRYDQFIAHIHAVYLQLGYSEADAIERTNAAEKRINSSEGKLYGKKPSHHLARMKRLTRNEIRIAIMQRPERVAQIKLLRDEYNKRVSEHYSKNPDTPVFSFEHVYARELKVRFGDFADLFKLAPKDSLPT